MEKKEALKVLKNLIDYPFGQICKHSVMLDIIVLSGLDTEENNDLIRAITRADDDKAEEILKRDFNI